MSPEKRKRLEEMQDRLRQLEGEIARRKQAQSSAPEPEAEGFKPKEKEKWYEDFGEGLAVSGLKTYYGLKDLAGAFDDEDRARLADWQADAAESGWGTAGTMVGDIGQIVVPGGGALKLARGLNTVKNATQGLRHAIKVGTPGVMLATDTAASAGLGALQAPASGDTSRLTGAMEGAVGALGGHALGGALGKAATGIRQTLDAQDLGEMGIRLTPGQASENPIWRGVEFAMSKVPGLAKGVQEQRETALSQWNKAAINEVRAPGTPEIDKIGYKGIEELQAGFKQRYADAWAQASRPSQEAVDQFKADIQRAGSRLSGDSQKIMNNIADDMDDVFQNFTPEKMHQLHDLIKEAQTLAGSGRFADPWLTKALDFAHDRYREILGPNVKAALDPIDRQYRKYVSVAKAARGSHNVSEQGGETLGNIFSPKQLRQHDIARTSTNEGASGRGPMTRWADKAASTIGRTEPAALNDVQMAVARHMIAPTGALAKGADFVLGRTATQDKMRKLWQSQLIQELRKISPSRAATGGAYWQDE